MEFVSIERELKFPLPDELQRVVAVGVRWGPFAAF